MNKSTKSSNARHKTFSPVSSINSSKKDKALPVKTSKPNFVTFMYFGNSLLDYLWNFFVCYGSKPGSHFARNLREFGVARSEELEVNQWIVQDIHWLSSQSERAKNTIHCFSIIILNENIFQQNMFKLQWFKDYLFRRLNPNLEREEDLRKNISKLAAQMRYKKHIKVIF